MNRGIIKKASIFESLYVTRSMQLQKFMESFRVILRKRGNIVRKKKKYRKSKLRDLTDYVHQQHEKYADKVGKMQIQIDWHSVNASLFI